MRAVRPGLLSLLLTAMTVPSALVGCGGDTGSPRVGGPISDFPADNEGGDGYEGPMDAGADPDPGPGDSPGHGDGDYGGALDAGLSADGGPDAAIDGGPDAGDASVDGGAGEAGVPGDASMPATDRQGLQTRHM